MARKININLRIAAENKSELEWSYYDRNEEDYWNAYI
jgi:hypothetical protein